LEGVYSQPQVTTSSTLRMRVGWKGNPAVDPAAHPARTLPADQGRPNSLRNRDGQGGNRTPDTRIFSPLLYQLSYLAERLCNVLICLDFLKLRERDSPPA
jgi:hypothetical protein